MKKDNKDNEIKVGSIIRIKSEECDEYPNYCAGSKGIVVKIGNKYCKVECFARVGLINVEFNHLEVIDKSRFDDYENKWIGSLYKRNNLEEED